MSTVQAHIFAIATPLLAALSQIIIKWQVNRVSSVPESVASKALFLVELLTRPWVMVAIAATFLGGITWIMAMTKLDISYAYPYVAATFVIVPMAGVLLFGESLSAGKVFGGGLILLGIGIVMVKG